MMNTTQIRSIFQKRSTAEYKNFSSTSCFEKGVRPVYVTKLEEELSKHSKEKWTYTINQHGYRNAYNEYPILPCVGFYGCSNTFGMGVPDYNVVSEVFKNNTREIFETYNFGIPGASISRTGDVFSLSAELLPIKVAIFNLPSYYRYTFIAQGVNSYKDILPDFRPPEFGKFQKEYYKHSSELHFKAAMIQHVDRILLHAEKNDIKVYMCSWELNTQSVIEEVYPKYLLPISYLPYRDFGRDNSHPGPEHHKAFGTEIAKFIKTEFGFSNV